MCFGPIASFTAGTVLLSLGTVILRKIRAKRELLFAAFPILFALQQFIEGLLWLVFQNGKSEAFLHVLAFAYLALAYSLWPVLCPISVYVIEYDAKRKKILRALILLGAATSSYLLFFIITHPFYVTVLTHCIRYKTFVANAHWFTAV